MPIRGFSREAVRNQRLKVTSDTIVSFGGLVEEEHPLARRPSDLVDARNCMRKGEMLGTRPGLELNDGDYDAARSGTPGCQGLYEFRINKDADRDLISVFDGNVYTSHDGSAVDKTTNSVTISSGDDYLWTFAPFQNKVFAAGGNPATDSVWYWSGSGALNKLNLAGMSISAGAQYVFQKWNIMFLGGLNGTGASDNPLCARYHTYGTDPTLVASWPTSNVIPGIALGNNFGPGSYGSEFNTGFGSFTDNRDDFLLFLTNRRIVPFAPNLALTGPSDAFTMSDSIDIGCVSQRAFVNLGQDVGDAVYMSPNGVHSLAISKQYGNRTSDYLSWPIRKTFSSLNRSRLKYSTGAYWPDEGVVVFLVSAGSSTTHNRMLCLDIRGAQQLTPDQVRWYVWDFPTGLVPNFIAAARGSDDKPYIYVGDLAGRVMRFFRSSYSDDGSAIPVSIQVANDSFGSITSSKIVGDTFLLLQGSGNHAIQHRYILNDGEAPGKATLLTVPAAGLLWGSGTWGSGVWGGENVTQRQRIYGVGSTPTIGHRFTHSGAGQPFWVGSLAQEAFISGPARDAESNTAVS